jgi:hypothetical protein
VDVAAGEADVVVDHAVADPGDADELLEERGVDDADVAQSPQVGAGVRLGVGLAQTGQLEPERVELGDVVERKRP